MISLLLDKYLIHRSVHFLFDFSGIVRIITRFMIAVSEKTIGGDEETLLLTPDAQKASVSPVSSALGDVERELVGVGERVKDAVLRTYPDLPETSRRQIFKNAFRAVVTSLCLSKGVNAPSAVLTEVASVQSKVGHLLEALGLEVS
jgi:hypothetical protein